MLKLYLNAFIIVSMVMKNIFKIHYIIFLFLLVIQSTSLKAEIVKPTFKQSFSLNGVVNSPADVELSSDGTKIFFSAFHENILYQYTLTTPFDISTLDTSSEVQLDLTAGDDDIGSATQGHAFNNDGTKVFAISSNGTLNAHTLTSPYDLSNLSQVADDGINWRTAFSAGDGDVRPHDITFNNDGTKMYLTDTGNVSIGDGGVVEYDLSTPYDTSTASFVNELVVSDKLSLYENGFEFDDDGTRLYVTDSHISGNANHKIAVYKLSKPFHTSSATFVGSITNFFDASGSTGTPLGLSFSSDGMKLYQVTYTNTGAGALDMVYEYNLSCPYGIVICETDSITNVGAQVEFAKHVIQQNTSTVFKRFEWIRRNEGKNNLNSNNINLNIYNPVLSSLKKQLKSTFTDSAIISIGLNEKKYSQVSLVEKKNKKNKNWSYWSHGDISFGRKGDTATSKPKEIKVSGLMFGADKKINNNKFVGAAIRFGKGEIESISPGGIELDTESLTLNLYSTIPVNNNSNLNALFGVSLLRIDQLLSNEITGERNGKQAFAALNLQSKDSYGNFNIRPTGKFEFGVTQFSEYTDFGTSSTNSQDTYDSLTFKTGNIAAGFKFDNLIDINDGRLSRNGSLEYIRDLTSNIDYKFKNHSDNVLVTKTVETHSIHNIKGNLGFEILYENGYTFALNYERFQGLDYSSHQDSIFFKFGHIREEDSEFAFNYKPLQNNQMELSYVKDVKGFDVKVSSNYSMVSQIPDYGANLEISNKF